MNPGGVEQLIYTEPKNALQGKFSMQFCLAIILLEKKGGLAQFTDAKVRDPKTVELMKRINLYVDQELTESLPLGWVDKTATVKVRMKDGREYKRTADIKHLTWDELKSKYEECARLVLPENKLKGSIDVIMSLEKAKSLNPLMECIVK
jgi:2-methylcitrate dehydratase PrpD